MTTVEDVVDEALIGTPDGPMLAHISEEHFYEDFEPFVALCGTRLLGIPIENPPYVCEKCLDIVEEAFGDRQWPRPGRKWDFLPSWVEKHK